MAAAAAGSLAVAHDAAKATECQWLHSIEMTDAGTREIRRVQKADAKKRDRLTVVAAFAVAFASAAAAVVVAKMGAKEMCARNLRFELLPFSKWHEGSSFIMIWMRFNVLYDESKFLEMKAKAKMSNIKPFELT